MAKVRRDVVAVVHVVYARTPQEHLVKLFIADVPPEVGEELIKDALDAAGYRFAEFGIRWANHYLVRLHQANPQVRSAWRQELEATKDGGDGEVPFTLWSNLIGETYRGQVLFLRVPSKLKDALAQRAQAQKLSVNEYCARILAAAAQSVPDSRAPESQ